MARDIRANSEALVLLYKSSSGLNDQSGFESFEERRDFIHEFAPASITQCISDCNSAFGGSPRLQTFVAATITASEEEDIGIRYAAPYEDQLYINADLYAIYKNADSFIVHEGSAGYLVFKSGNIYWFPSTGGNTDDFERFQTLLEYHMAYKYTDSAYLSEIGEKMAALDGYEEFRDQDLIA